MDEWKDRCIVTGVGHFGESHIWLRALFEHRGLQTVFAFGGAISRKRFCGCLDTLNVLDCLVRESKNGAYLTLQEAGLVKMARNLRHDWKSMGMMNNCLRFLQMIGVSSDSSRECFAILEDLMDYLEDHNGVMAFLPIFFRLRVGAALGYSPNFQTCGDCGALLGQGIFLADEGRIYCEKCVAARSFAAKRRAFYLDRECLQLCGSIIRNLPSQFCRTGMKPSVLRQCANAIDGFVEYHMGIIWDKGTFQRI